MDRAAGLTAPTRIRPPSIRSTKPRHSFPARVEGSGRPGAARTGGCGLGWRSSSRHVEPHNEAGPRLRRGPGGFGQCGAKGRTLSAPEHFQAVLSWASERRGEVNRPSRRPPSHLRRDRPQNRSEVPRRCRQPKSQPTATGDDSAQAFQLCHVDPSSDHLPITWEGVGDPEVRSAPLRQRPISRAAPTGPASAEPARGARGMPRPPLPRRIGRSCGSDRLTRLPAYLLGATSATITVLRGLPPVWTTHDSAGRGPIGVRAALTR
jgi:hypothetical protein